MKRPWRRSVREALVGFSLAWSHCRWLRPVVLVAGGISTSVRNNWLIKATCRWPQAGRSLARFFYRGVQVGKRQKHRNQPAGRAGGNMEISGSHCSWPGDRGPRSETGSRCWEAMPRCPDQQGHPLPKTLRLPGAMDCDKGPEMVCAGGELQGVEAARFDSVTELMQQLLSQADSRTDPAPGGQHHPQF